MSYITETLFNLVHQTAFLNLTWGIYLMISVGCVYSFVAITNGLEPLLLVPTPLRLLLSHINQDIMSSPADTGIAVAGRLH